MTKLLIFSFFLYSHLAYSQCDTSRWKGTIGYLSNPTTILNASQFIDATNGWSYISPSLASTSYYWASNYFKDTLCITSNFSMEIRMKVDASTGISAYDTRINLMTSGGDCWAQLMGASWGQPWTSLGVMNTTVLSNHSSLIFPSLGTWARFKMKFENNQLKYYVNDTIFYTGSYTGNICNIYGLDYAFKGSGYVDWIKIRDNRDTIVWQEDFNGCNNIQLFPDLCNTTYNLNISNTPPTCTADTLKLFATTAPILPQITYLWTGPKGFTSTSPNPKIPNPTSVNLGKYVCIAKLNECTSVKKDSFNFSTLACLFDLDVSGSFSTCKDTISIAQNLAITDGDASTLIDGAKVFFDAGYIKLEDSLTINTQYGITTSFDTATGVLHITGNATKSQYETVLKSIKYKNLKTNKTIATKSIRFVLGKALYNANNGHYYKIVNNGSTINWSVARDSCIASRFFGLQGYLVTLTDSSENDFVFKLIKDNSWIGASDANTEGVWRWVTGCEGLENGGLGRHFSNQIGNCGGTTGTGSSANGNFQSWWTGEPNDASCIEDYAQFVILGNGKWNDLPNSAGISKYIIEYGCMPNDPIIDIQGSVLVNIINSSFTTITQSICQGDSFAGKKTTGTYIDTFTSSNGCDSVRTLNLTVNPRTTSTISQTICQGDSFLGHKVSGTFIDMLKNANSKGCDSIRTLNLTVNPNTTSNTTQAICSGQSFWGYTTTGVYRDTFRNANSKGCDSIRILNLTASPNILKILTITQCNAYFFKGQNRTTTGTYRDTTRLASGCDSITELQLNIPVPTSMTKDTSACDSFRYKSKTYKVNSNILDTIKSSINCDSIYKTIRLTIHKATTLPKDSLTACKEIEYNGLKYYKDTLLNIRIPKSVFPYCDSLLKTAKLRVFPLPNAKLTATPDTLVKYGETINLTASGGSLYQWNVSSLSTNQISIPIQARTYVEVKVIDHNQCDSSVGLWLDNLPELNVTEVFSPNGDGKNDIFTPTIKGNVIIHSWRIFNRWGQKIFESNNLNQGWDGKFKGQDQPQGSYVYQIEYTLNNVKTIKTGAVTLIR